MTRTAKQARPNSNFPMVGDTLKKLVNSAHEYALTIENGEPYEGIYVTENLALVSLIELMEPGFIGTVDSREFGKPKGGMRYPLRTTKPKGN